MRRRWTLYALLGCVTVGLVLAWPPIRFTEESIALTLSPDRVEVDGTYVYENPYPLPLVMGFSVPFPVDENHPYPVLIHAERFDGEGRPIPLRDVLGKLRFDLTFKPRETIVVRVRYTQYAPDQTCRYILTTTRPWKRPMRRTKYTVRTEGVILVSSNYAADKVDEDLYAFERESFMPEKDWKLRWEAEK